MSNQHVGISEEEFQLFKQGDHSSFQKVFDLFNRQVFSYLFAFTKSKEDTEELLQESFVSLFTNRHNIPHKEGIYPFLFVIAKRMLISDFRKKVVRSKFQNHLSFSWNEATSETQELLDAKDLYSTLENLMATLPTKEQEVFRLSKLNGMSYQEIAEHSGISKNTVKNQLISASKKIKWKIKKTYYLPFLFFFLNL